jgi:hypothetical protein
MAHPQVADEGDALQFWRVAVNILNKQSRTEDKGWSSSWGVGRGDNNLTVKNKLLTKDHKKPRTWTDFLDKRSKRKKMDMRFGTWNVRSTYRAGSLRAVAEQISKYKLDLVAVQEVRLDGGGTEPVGVYTFSMEKRMKIMN